LVEAPSYEKALSSMMDPRSTSLLNEKVFSVDTEKRPFFISLLGKTKDKGAEEPLRRLMEFSTVDEDREAARAALVEMGSIEKQ
jgi:hypothetical protein